MGTDKDERYTDFSETLAALGGGIVNESLSSKLNELTRAVREVGKAGTLTLKLTVKPEGAGLGTMIGLSTQVTVKRPEPAMPGAIYYASDDGVLHADDPRQLKLRTLPPVVPLERRIDDAVAAASPIQRAPRPLSALRTTTDEEGGSK